MAARDIHTVRDLASPFDLARRWQGAQVASSITEYLETASFEPMARNWPAGSNIHNFVTNRTKPQCHELVWSTTKYERTLLCILQDLNIGILGQSELLAIAHMIPYARDATELIVT